jgi:uncharacterized protein YjbI with pentapeptide repeats
VPESRQTLRKRWRDGAGAERAAAVLERLQRGLPLNDLGLDEHEGRLDLRGLALPEPRSVRHLVAGSSVVEEKAGYFEVREARWERLDLSHAALDSLRAAGLRASDCRFAAASMRGIRLWAAEIDACSFDGANLRDAGLGGWSPGRGGNRFARSSFRGADLRETDCPTAAFEDCDFSGARLDKVEFGASRFERCRFAGPLREVIFARSDLVDTGNGLERVDLGNELRDCDFRDAVLFWCDFRELDLRSVMLPSDPELIVVHHYGCVVERLLSQFEGDWSPAALALRGKLDHDRKWLHPDREVGLWHRAELRESGGDDVVAEAERALREAELQCASDGERSRLRRLVRRVSG